MRYGQGYIKTASELRHVWYTLGAAIGNGPAGLAAQLFLKSF